jgi:hypothetical protein
LLPPFVGGCAFADATAVPTTMLASTASSAILFFTDGLLLPAPWHYATFIVLEGRPMTDLRILSSHSSSRSPPMASTTMTIRCVLSSLRS